MTVGQHYLDTAIASFRSLKEMGERTFRQLAPAELHWQPEPESNSIAVVIQHLSGNMLSRWTDFLTTDGEKPNRDRDAEFEAGTVPAADLLGAWERGWKTIFDTLTALREEDLLKTVHIRSKPLTVLDAITKQISHYAYHVGQIVYVAKHLKGDRWATLSVPKRKAARTA